MTYTRSMKGGEQAVHVPTVRIRTWSDWSQLAPTRCYERRGRSNARGEQPIPRREILVGDASNVLRTLPTACVDCVVTSPPYFLLRDYQTGGQLGLEATVDEYVKNIVEVFDEVARVLKPSGSVWLNLGDSYSRHDRYGAPPKAMLLAPERILIALAKRGWLLRNKIIWAKPNPMPTSVRDRLNTTWEPIYFLVRSPHYFFDLDAIREPHRSQRPASRVRSGAKYSDGRRPAWAGPLAGGNEGLIRLRSEGRAGHARGKNPGDVWGIPTAGYRGAHFATFPPRLITKPIQATCPEQVCAACGQPWECDEERRQLAPACNCRAPSRPGVVLDPFIGAGTTAIVAEQLGRDWLGIELNADYRAMALERIETERAKRAVPGAEGETPMAA